MSHEGKSSLVHLVRAYELGFSPVYLFRREPHYVRVVAHKVRGYYEIEVVPLCCLADVQRRSREYRIVRISVSDQILRNLLIELLQEKGGSFDEHHLLRSDDLREFYRITPKRPRRR